ncbi:MAG: TRAP transporter large permease subunit [Salinicola sp.]|nr:TRAP transporter large permease subunit [Salinicola sp.]NRB57687.1 TRAP transporter large permease subunit [Salinicola sp.]
MLDLSAGTQMIILFFVLVLIRVPVAFSLALSAMAAMYVMGFGLDMVGDLIVSGIAKYSLLAIPFFILAGNIMGITGIAEKMINFFRTLVGGLPGGMGLVGTVGCLFWGAVSGSGPASVAAIGPLIIRGMVADGYSRAFAAGLVCTGAALSLIIPPSIGLVIYGILAGTSISDLFLAAILDSYAQAAHETGASRSVARKGSGALKGSGPAHRCPLRSFESPASTASIV